MLHSLVFAVVYTDMRFVFKSLGLLFSIHACSTFACVDSDIPYTTEIIAKEAYESKDSFEEFIVKLPYIHKGWKLERIGYSNGTVNIPIHYSEQDEKGYVTVYFFATVDGVKAAKVEAIYHPLPTQDGEWAMCAKGQVIEFGI